MAAKHDPQFLEQLAVELGVSPVIAGMLLRRGLTDPEAASRFLHPERSGFYDPFLMKDMEKAVDRIRQAIANRERIMVYGDYDADGATSTSLMYLALRKAGGQVEYYIPDRFEEGYGLNGPAILQAKERGFDLIVTVDNGISAVEEVRLARNLGLDLIVTDHHTPPQVLPEAYAILNPKQPDCGYPDKMLAGVGVAFKLAQALLGELPEEFLDLAAIGTIADLAPLLDENRLLAIYGLQRINRSPQVGIKALIEVSGLSGKDITAGHIGFSFGPRINASGRLDSAAYAVELLITEDEERARELADFLNQRNQERQEISGQIFEEAVVEIEAHPEMLTGRVLVVAKEGWNAGVIGIVASRLVEKYYRPTLMISITDGMGKGSARSIDGFHLYDAMAECRDLFDHFGGHKMAAGFSLAADRIDELRDRLNRTASEVLTTQDMIPKIEIDAELELSEVSMEFVREVEGLAPFGFGNPGPRFQLNGLTLERCRRVGQDGAHLQLVVRRGAAQLGGIAFQRGEEADLINEWQRLDLVGELNINEWNGKQSLQIQLSDWRPNGIQVFDRRRVEDKRRWLEEQAGRKDLVVVCFHQETVAEAAKLLELYPWQEPHRHRVYLADPDGEIRLVCSDSLPDRNTAGEDSAVWLSGDVVFYDLPLSIEQYQAVLRRLQAEFRLYLIYGATDKVWVEQRKRTLLPDRKVFAGIYNMLQDLQSCSAAEIRKRMPPSYHDAADFILSVFVELGFAVQDGNTYHVNKGTGKRPLETSELYQTRLMRIEAYMRVIDSLIETSNEQAVAAVYEWLYQSEGVQIS
jgi:single-stranded-DNA-specific exonuclease